MKLLKIILLLLFFLLVLLFVFLNSKTQANNNKKLEICTVTKNNKIVFHGFIKAQHSSDLSFQSEGKIVFMPYSQGDYVKKGQVLARLDGALYKIRKREQDTRLKEAIIQYNKAKSYYSRMDVLHKAGAISDNDWEDAYYQLKTNKEEIEIQKEKINYLNKEISYNILLSPYDGYISEKYSQIGEVVKIGQPVLNIMGSDVTRVEIMVSVDDVNYIQVNDFVTVKSSEKIYKGKIAHISKTSINSGGYLVKINLDGIYSELKDGMDVDVELISNSSKIYIPINSIFEESSDKFVYKILDNESDFKKIAKQNISTGRFLRNEVEILSGLKQGDFFVCGNFDELKKYQKRIIKYENQ